MRVIDFISLGVDDMAYVIADNSTSAVKWRGTRPEFLREMTAFFMFFYVVVKRFDIGKGKCIWLYI